MAMLLHRNNFRSRAKEVKEKFSFLRRRHTDTSLHGKMGGDKPGSSKSSSDAARSWTKSFDTLLMDKRKYWVKLVVTRQNSSKIPTTGLPTINLFQWPPLVVSTSRVVLK